MGWSYVHSGLLRNRLRLTLFLAQIWNLEELNMLNRGHTVQKQVKMEKKCYA